MNDNKYKDAKCQRIKFLVEQFSGIKNIGGDSRLPVIADMKKIYCKLAKETTNASLETIGFNLNGKYTHASVLNAIKNFDDLYPTKQLNKREIYIEILEAIAEMDLIDSVKKRIAKISEYTLFLDWFRQEINKNDAIESSYFVGKYLNQLENY